VTTTLFETDATARTKVGKRKNDIRQVIIPVDTSGRHPLLDLTPAQVGSLTGPQREQRVARLLTETHEFYDRGRRELVEADGKTLAATGVLFSGGRDSTTLAHIMRGRCDVAIHANTSIGIEPTRQFVRDTCSAWGLPLIEKLPPPGERFEDIVLRKGFPGPGDHGRTYDRLKGRALEAARNDLITDNRRERVIYLAGRRRDESKRRAKVEILERRRTIVYVSPLTLWTAFDLTTYRLMTGDVPTNQVSDLIHMSGECCCGSFAEKDELEMIGFWFPDVMAWIRDLEGRALIAAKAGAFPVERARWGWGAYRPPHRRLKPSGTGIACGGCVQSSLWDDQQPCAVPDLTQQGGVNNG
jgi:3'-phosphoadenosine 5'-phosphosulfate sulfotransferase (PAPS reductase)/FAD synthetase